MRGVWRRVGNTAVPVKCRVHATGALNGCEDLTAIAEAQAKYIAFWHAV